MGLWSFDCWRWELFNNHIRLSFFQVHVQWRQQGKKFLSWSVIKAWKGLRQTGASAPVLIPYWDYSDPKYLSFPCFQISALSMFRKWISLDSKTGKSCFMTMYITDFPPLMLVVIYQNLISLLFLYSAEVIKDNWEDFQLPYFWASESAEPLIKLGCSYQTIPYQ